MKFQPKHALVVGASSGIGRELARQLAQQGCKVAAVARRKDRLDELAAEFPGRVLPFEHDVRNYAEVPELFQRIASDLGGLDLVIYASGVMPEVGLAEYSFDKDRDMIEVNVLGAIAWLDQAATRFHSAKHGAIVGVGSVAGDRGRAGQPVYNASKAFVATYLEALRNRLSKHGVVVSTVKPGPVATEMTARVGLKPKMSAEEAARRILRKGLRTGEHYLVPTHRLIFYILKRIPSPLFRRLGL